MRRAQIGTSARLEVLGYDFDLADDVLIHRLEVFGRNPVFEDRPPADLVTSYVRMPVDRTDASANGTPASQYQRPNQPRFLGWIGTSSSASRTCGIAYWSSSAFTCPSN